MNRKFLSVIALSIMTLASCTNKEQVATENPFLSDYGTPYEVPAFDKIKTEPTSVAAILYMIAGVVYVIVEFDYFYNTPIDQLLVDFGVEDELLLTIFEGIALSDIVNEPVASIVTMYNRAAK